MTVTQVRKQHRVPVARWSTLKDRQPSHGLVADVDLVVVRYDDQVSVLYGRCLHRGALMADAKIDGGNIVCGVHGWDYRIDTGVSSYNNEEFLQKFRVWIDHFHQCRIQYQNPSCFEKSGLSNFLIIPNFDSRFMQGINFI